MVVGGVADGMNTAVRLHRRDEGAEVIVLGRGSYMSFTDCGFPHYAGGEIEDSVRLLLHTPQSPKAALSLDMCTNSEVIAIDPDAHPVTVANPDTGETYTLSCDHLILPLGALAARPSIDGLDSPRVHTLHTADSALALREASGTHVIMLGTGFIGTEAAEALTACGFETHLAELVEHILPPLEAEIATLVTQELHGLGTHVHVGVAAQTITHAGNDDVVALFDGTVLHVDAIVLSADTRPGTAVVEAVGIQTHRGYVVIDDHGRTSADDAYATGDGAIGRDHDRPVALVGPMNRGERLIADAITDAERGETTARSIPSPQGAAIARTGSLTAVMTGTNRQAPDALGTEHFAVHTHTSQRTDYFPGTQPMHILMHVGAGGEILGTQAMGTGDADRRIDVIATAMRAGLETADLIDLDLAYVPSYGQAKGPANQAGMVAHNVATGESILAGLDTLTENAPVLDMRTSGEYATRHISNSLNIPHTQLRNRLDGMHVWVDESAYEQPFVVMYAAGVCSQIDCYIVRVVGSNMTMLSGGTQASHAWLGDCAATVLVKEQGRSIAMQTQIMNRLKRVHGQPDALIEQLESRDGNCQEISTQFAAVDSTMKRANYLTVTTVMPQCVQEIVGSRDEVDPESA